MSGNDSEEIGIVGSLPNLEWRRDGGVIHFRSTAPDVTAGDALRSALLKHHPIAHSETGALKGCRCGQVRLGQDVIAHVIEHLPELRALIAERDELRAVVARVRELHAPVVNWAERECEACSTVCRDDECLSVVPWPCPTARALDGPTPSGGLEGSRNGADVSVAQDGVTGAHSEAGGDSGAPDGERRAKGAAE
jgi:hypothetical protein